LERAVAKAAETPADDRGRAQVGLGLLLTWQGELEAAESLFATGIPLLRAASLPEAVTLAAGRAHPGDGAGGRSVRARPIGRR
jgi:hypothetical protein